MQTMIKPGGQVVVEAAPSGGYTSGDLVAVGSVLGVAKDTYAEGDRAVIQTIGTHGGPWAVAGETWAEGEPVFYNSASGELTTLETEWLVGVAAAIKPAAEPYCQVEWNRSAIRQGGSVVYSLLFDTGFSTAQGLIGTYELLAPLAYDIRIDSLEVIAANLASATNAATLNLGDGTAANDQVFEVNTVVELNGFGQAFDVDLNAVTKLPVVITAGNALVLQIAVEDITAGLLSVRVGYHRSA
jgi:predicted RecA/RadA family phage recombinase